MTHPHWNDSYTSGDSLPWDTGEPDTHLVEAWQSGGIHGHRVLEVGCGTGTNSAWLAEQGCDVLGIDVAAAAIGRARARTTTARFAVADFLKDKLAEPSFDLVFDRGCFHIFDEAIERETFAKRVAAALVPGGSWLSLIGSTEGPPRDMGPPRRSLRDVIQSIEPALRVIEVRAVAFATNGYGSLAAWLCLSSRRDVPAQPSTSSQ